jgi:HEAT repeat protein
VPAVVEILQHGKTEYDREEAAGVLRRMRDKRATKALVALVLSDDVLDLRLKAINALDWINDPSAIPDVVRAFAKPGTDPVGADTPNRETANALVQSDLLRSFPRETLVAVLPLLADSQAGTRLFALMAIEDAAPKAEARPTISSAIDAVRPLVQDPSHDSDFAKGLLPDLEKLSN